MEATIQTLIGVCQCGHVFEDHRILDWITVNDEPVADCLICDCIHYEDEIERKNND